MSKSLGNFFTLRDLLARGFTGREIRYLLLTAHYRETFNFTLDGLQGARTSLARINECLTRLLEFWDQTPGPIRFTPDQRLLGQFSQALDDDLNISKAWGVVFQWVRGLNRLIAGRGLSADQAAIAVGTWKELDRVLGLELTPRSPLRMSEVRGVVPSGFLADVRGEEEAPAEIKHLLMQRMQARAAKNFKLADALRDELKAKGWVIEDTPKGARAKRL